MPGVNRLAREPSPYLLQHASNPVDWFPWGDEAFSRARSEGKPIFLSIGYSTCHWCHVMAHESFENDEVAAVLNEHFVSIKVDREERPDVDRVYMAFVQRTTGSGGWPMSVWLTPDLKPFYGGTYFPPSSRWGRPGFVELLLQIAEVWRSDRDRIVESAAAALGQLQDATRSLPSSAVPTPHALAQTVAQFKAVFDARHGGFGGAPKFPRPSELLFLLREHARTGDAQALEMATATLRAMALGGMRDHIGGGFHRYSVDAAWRVPHFEKMLYDQAQLVLGYLEAAQASGDPFFAEVAEDTLQYVIRDLTGPEGGFYSAEDADSVPPEAEGSATAHKAEGAFYLWRAVELDAILGSDAPVIRGRFGVETQGNAPSDPQQEFVGKNLLYVARSVDELAAEHGTTPDEIAAILTRARAAMFRARSTRPRPHLDGKILTAWNGLMIGAFARAARVVRAMGSDAASGGTYLDSARRAATFVQHRLWDEKAGVLRRRFRDGQADIDAYAEDHAFLVFGLLELLQADPDVRWLEWVVALQRRMDELFWDEEEGGWFSTTGRDPSVLVRMKEDYDGAEPAASSVAVLNLLTLSHLVEDNEWAGRIERTLRLFGERLSQMGRAVPMMSAALSSYAAGMTLVCIVGERGAFALERAVVARYRPFTIAMALDDTRRTALARVMPVVGSMLPQDSAARAYVCRQFTCLPPVSTGGALEEELEEGVHERSG
jgi:hypothetical protein